VNAFLYDLWPIVAKNESSTSDYISFSPSSSKTSIIGFLCHVWVLIPSNSIKFCSFELSWFILLLVCTIPTLDCAFSFCYVATFCFEILLLVSLDF